MSNLIHGFKIEFTSKQANLCTNFKTVFVYLGSLVALLMMFKVVKYVSTIFLQYIDDDLST